MSKLRIFNEDIYIKSLSIKNSIELACPNLVSSKRFLNSIESNPMLYLGQETYSWVNYNTDKLITLDEIEDSYDYFMIDRGTSRTSPFWQFISKSTNIDYNDLYKHVVWSNTLLMGKRYSSGTPKISEELINLSLKNILFLYDYFKPSSVILANGNSNPYWFITNKFLSEIGSNLTNKWPTSTSPLLIDEDKKIFWTFHPRRLQYNKGKFKETTNKVYSIIKK